MTIAGMGFAGRGQNQGLRLRQAQGLGSARPAGSPGAGGRRPGDGGPRRASAAPWSSPSRRRPSPSSAWRPASTSCSRTAAGWGTRSCSRRCTSSSAWPPRTRASPGSGPTAWPTCRSTRSTSTGRRPARSASPQLDPELPLDRVRQRLRRQLRPGRAGQARLRPGRRPLPDAPGRPRPPPRPQPPRQARPALGRRLRALGLRLAAARALQRLPGDEHPGRGRAGAQHRRGDAGDGGARGQAPAGDRVRVDRPLLPAADVRVPGRAALRLLGPGDLPRPGGALRELDLPDLRHAGPAARRHRRRDGLLARAACPTTSTSRSASSPCSA